MVVLTKADLHPCPGEPQAETAALAFGTPVHLVSSRDGSGLESLDIYLKPGRTVALIGSSGAGKSTLINRLAGDDLRRVREVSPHMNKGVHTTTSRDLILLPGRGMILDNPGIREIALWTADGEASAAFPEIRALARDCRFADCTHTHEPGCRVREAVEAGELSARRLQSFQKIGKESEYLAQRMEMSADRVEKERWKSIAKLQKRMKRYGKPGRS